MQLKHTILFLFASCTTVSCSKTASTYDTSSTRKHTTVNVYFSDHSYQESPETVNLQQSLSHYSIFSSGATVGVNRSMVQIMMYTPNLNFIISGDKLNYDALGTYIIGQYNDTPNLIYKTFGYIDILDKTNGNIQYKIFPDSTSSNIQVTAYSGEELKGTFQLKMLDGSKIVYANGDFDILTTLN